MAKVKTPRWGWALTGSGHFFKECLAMIHALDEVDLFVTRAAAEVVRMYKQDLTLPKSARIFRDTAASAPPVGNFYYNVYHTLVLAPATSIGLGALIALFLRSRGAQFFAPLKDEPRP